MSRRTSISFRRLWDATSRPDRAALLVALLYVAVLLAREWGRELPFSGLIGFFFVLACIYGVFRIGALAQRHSLWSLRNRLIVAYLFIAVVPILLLLTMAALSGFMLYSQLGAYVLNRDIQSRLDTLQDLAQEILTASPGGGKDYPSARDAAPGAQDPIAELLATQAQEFPGIELHWNRGAELLPSSSQSAGRLKGDRRFTGLFQEKDKIWLRSVVSRSGPRGPITVDISVPVDVGMLEKIAPQLGVVQLSVMQPATEAEPQAAKNEFTYTFDGRNYRSVARLSTVERNLTPAAGWWDREVTGISRLEARALEEEGAAQTSVPVFASFSARPSQLSRHLFSSLGDLSDLMFQLLLGIGVLFLVIEAGALFVGVRITQSITESVADLYAATQHVQSGDFTYRIRTERKDQLGELGKSFNAMTASVSNAIEEQRRRERLENELSIAHEVQSQLFPRVLPRMSGLELAAQCRAARTVSGDYYDFIPLGPSEMAMIVADIAGKGISAALLMASLHAALRSQLLQPANGPLNTGAVVKRLNRHLLLSTPEDRYATLFFAIFDSANRVLRYTNAGHLPPFCFTAGGVQQLEEGGTVVGMFEDCEFDQGRVTIAPGSLLMAYTDGLVEPENAYGEEFGRKRLMNEVLRHRQAKLDTIVESVLAAVEDWAGTPERYDDMTVVLASVT